MSLRAGIPAACAAALAACALGACGARTAPTAAPHPSTTAIATPGSPGGDTTPPTTVISEFPGATATDGSGGSTGTAPTTPSPAGSSPGTTVGAPPGAAGGQPATSTPPVTGPAVFYTPNGGPPKTLPPDETAAIRTTYQTFLTDVAGYDDTLNPNWVTALKEVATPPLVAAAQHAEGALALAKTHGVGTLVDSHLAIEAQANAAALVDCLDEYNFYLVDPNGKPDPTITRGYYTGAAAMVLQGGRWYVSTWSASAKPCTF